QAVVRRLVPLAGPAVGRADQPATVRRDREFVRARAGRVRTEGRQVVRGSEVDLLVAARGVHDDGEVRLPGRWFGDGILHGRNGAAGEEEGEHGAVACAAGCALYGAQAEPGGPPGNGPGGPEVSCRRMAERQDRRRTASLTRGVHHL